MRIIALLLALTLGAAAEAQTPPSPIVNNITVLGTLTGGTINGDSSGATILATGALNARTAAAMAADRINVLNQNVKTDGTDTTATLRTALALAVSLGKAAYLPCGTYTVDGLANPGGTPIITDGPCTILKRKNSAASGFVMSLTGAGNIIYPAIMIDGNASNNSVLANNLLISGASNFTLNGIISNNASDVGIFISGTADRANNTSSIISNFSVSTNGLAGLDQAPSTSGNIDNLTLMNGLASFNGATISGGGGFIASNFHFPFTSAYKATISNEKALNLTALGNTGTGVGWTGFVQAGATSFATAVPGPGNDPVFNLTAENLTANSNTGYGIVTQADQSSFTNLRTNGNGSAGTSFYAGILGTAENSEFKGVHTTETGLQYGTDAGGSYHDQFTDFHVIGATYGLNLESAQYVNVDGIDCPSFGSTGAGVCVRLARIGGTGTATSTGGNVFFPFDGNHMSVDHATCILASILQSCVTVVNDPQFISVRNSRSAYLASANISSDNNNVFTFQCTVGCNFSNNKTEFSDPYVPSQAVSGGNSLILNDWVEDVNITSTPNAGPITGIYTNFALTYLSAVYRVTITAGGSGYGAPIATATGGGCAVEPTITLGIRPDTNAVVGAIIATPGSGCSSAPTITITDSNGSGSGATATASVAPWGSINGRTIHLRSLSSTTLSFSPGSRIFTPNSNQLYLPTRSDDYITGYNAGGNFEWHMLIPTYATANQWTASGCSNSAIAGITKSDGSMNGTFVSGTTGACNVTMTASSSITAAHGYLCTARDVATGAAFTLSSSTATTAAITGTTTSGDTVAVNCPAY